jgi:hypothetical protein
VTAASTAPKGRLDRAKKPAGRRAPQDQKRLIQTRNSAMVRKTSIAAISLLFVVASAFAGTIDDQQSMKPMHAVSTDFGQRHFVSFFMSVDRRCDLTVVSATRMGESDRTAPGDVQRLRLGVDPARVVRIDTPDGGALQFACAPDASRMTMTALHRLANN